MNSEKYIGLDVHQATISVAVLDSTGKLIMESILETKAATILEFFAGLRGTLSVTFEEGTWAAWLYDVLHPHVANLIVCNPRKNALVKDGSKSDRIDAHKLAELLYLNKLSSVYHGENGVRMLRELARSYLTMVKDVTRVMSRLKAVYRSWAIPCAGGDVYYTRHRAEWLGKIKEAGVRRRAQRLYQQLDMLQHLRQQARRELLAESRKHIRANFLSVENIRTGNRGGSGRAETIVIGGRTHDLYSKAPTEKKWTHARKLTKEIRITPGVWHPDPGSPQPGPRERRR
jgi:transposase